MMLATRNIVEIYTVLFPSMKQHENKQKNLKTLPSPKLYDMYQ